MEYKVEFTPDAIKSVSKLSKVIQTQIKDKIFWLSNNSGTITHKKLKGKYFENVFKLRLGDYRILYTINKARKIIIIEFVGHRKDIYKT